MEAGLREGDQYRCRRRRVPGVPEEWKTPGSPLPDIGRSWYRWPIEIDGLPNLKMVDLSMANC